VPFSWDGRSPWILADDQFVPTAIIGPLWHATAPNRTRNDVPPELEEHLEGWVAVVPTGETPAVLLLTHAGGGLEAPFLEVTTEQGPNPYEIGEPGLVERHGCLVSIRLLADPHPMTMEWLALSVETFTWIPPVHSLADLRAAIALVGSMRVILDC
jgi:hypothetical protein